MVLLKHGDETRGQDPWAGRAEGRLIIYVGVGRGLRRACSLRNFGSKVPRTLRGPAVVGKGHLLPSDKT